MSNEKLIKKSDRFDFGLIIVLLSMSISIIAFITEDNKLTGFVTFEAYQSDFMFVPNNLREFNDLNSLTLASGNYYVDYNGVLYWIDDNSWPAVAKVNFLDDNQKNSYIYIDNNGRIGYSLSPSSITNK